DQAIERPVACLDVRRTVRLLDPGTVPPRREALTGERHHRGADVDPEVARRPRQVVAQQTGREAARPHAKLEDGLCLVEVGVRDQVGGRLVLVESLAVPPPPHPIIDRPGSCMAERRLCCHRPTSLTIARAVCGHAPMNSTACWTWDESSKAVSESRSRLPAGSIRAGIMPVSAHVALPRSG